MLLIAIAWLYVALMMAVAEAIHPQGSLLGAFFTLLMYGIGPLALVLYLVGTPARRRARRRAEAQGAGSVGASDPDGGGQAAAPGATGGVAPVREEA